MKYILIVLSISLVSTLQAQKIFTVEIEQSDPLKVDPGSAQTVCFGNDIILGGNPTATGGTGQLYYYWSPADKLDDPTISNPKAIIDEPTVFTLLVVDENGCSNQDYVKIGADLCTGINEVSIINEFHVFPNPASDEAFLVIPEYDQVSDIRLRFYDSIGRLLKEVKLDDHYSANTYKLPIEEMGPGMFFVQVSVGEISKVFKIQANKQ